MKKTMKQLFQKGISGLLCAAMILTSLSIPEMTAYAAETGIIDEMETADKTKDDITDKSGEQKTDLKATEESEGISGVENKEELNSDADKDDVNIGNGGGNPTDKTVDDPDKADETSEAAPKSDADVVGVAEMDLSEETDDDNGVTGGKSTKSARVLTNLLQNGDFEAAVNAESGWYPPNWTVGSGWDNGFKAEQDSTDETRGNYVSWWVDAASESSGISISQTVSDAAQGIYMVSADVAGEHPEGQFYLKVAAVTLDGDEQETDSKELTSIEIAEGAGWSAWEEISSVFELSEEDAGKGTIKVYVEGNIGGTEAQSFVLDNVELVLAVPKLQALYDEALAAKDDTTKDYTADSLSSLTSKIEAAKTVLDNEERTNQQISDIYAELKIALDGLEIKKEDKAVDITFNYYAGDLDADDDIAVISYTDSISFAEDATETEWMPSAWPKKCYLMEKSDKYKGWYSIGLKFSDVTDDEAGFNLYSKNKDSLLIEISVWKNTTTIYNKLISGAEESYAVKDGKCYEGEALVTAAMREVTLYVYSDTKTGDAADIPALMKENGKLSQISEDAEGVIGLSELTADEYDDGESNNHYYSMTKDNENPNWYYLTFSVPDTADASDKICALYSKADKDAWAKDFLNGPTDENNAEDSVDFTQVFDGKTYYKDGEFYDSIESAEFAGGITFGALKTLVDAANELVQSEYTTESWSEFAEELKTATELVTKLTDEGKGDTYKDEGDSTEIADAYNNLDAAMKDLEKKNRIINFSYYVGDTDGKGVGVYTYGSAISSTADPTKWNFWGNPIYEMTATDYFGWCTIPLTFSGSIDDADNKSNFQIGIEGSNSAVLVCGNTDGDESKGSTYFDIYSELFTGEDDSYAVKKVGDDFKLFKGDAADAVICNVTLHIYSESGVPAIVLDRANKLTYIDESSGTENNLENCTETKIDDWETNCYDMEAVGTTKWYSLSFTVPTPDNDGKFFDLAVKETESEAYTWNAKFVSVDSTDTTAPNFKSALKDGKTYYKDGVFYKSLDEIKGITLDDLKELIETTKEIKSEDYTETSWTVFATALGAAKEVVEKYEDESFEGTVDSTEVQDAYDNLAVAMKGLKERGRIITFNYYAGDVDDGDEVGIITWDDAIGFLDEDGNAAVAATWHPWDVTTNIAYTMAPDVDYPGWYSIKIEFGNGWKEDSNIQILKRKTLGVCEFKCDGANLKSIGEDTKTSYAAKLTGDNAEQFNLYKGDNAVVAIKRNVTLYVYSEEGVPAFMTESKLKYIDETDGSEKELTTISCTDSATYEDNGETKTGYNYYYNMEKEVGQENWYKLTFIAPYKDETGTYKVGELYTYNGGETPEKDDYTYVAKFHNGTWENMTAPDIDFTPVFKGNVYFKDGTFSDSRSMSLSALNNLITKAEDIQKGNYSDKTWTALTNAITSAKAVVKEIGNKEDIAVTEIEAVKITDAYNELDKAMKGLQEKGNAITFNYYAGDTQDKGVAVYYWGENSNISTTAESASWKAWNDTTTVYSMTPAQYSGWYTIDLTFVGKTTDNANFQILTETDKNNSVFKCGSEASSDNGGNVVIYNEIFAAAESTYAVQKFGDGYKLYKGEDEVSDAMRNVTLYVYSTEGTPAIKSDTELNYIDENDGSKKKLDASDTKTGETDGTTWNNYFYDMKSITDKQNWYELTFIASDTENTSDKICELYIKTDDEYKWKMNFLNGPVASGQEEWNVDFTPVFSGNAYYNNGMFYSSIDLAEGITLKMLEDLVNSDKITAIVSKGETGYTAESWTAFNTAYKAADDLVKACRADNEKNSDDYKSDDIKDKYMELSAAADAIVPVIQASAVTLYFYSEDLNEYTDTDTEKYNLYLSTWNNTKISSTKDEVDLSQGDWGYKAYEFEKVTDESINKGFDNWYTVPVKVLAANDGGDGDGFIIQLGKATTQDGETTHQALAAGAAIITISYWENSLIYAAIANAGDGSVIAIKDGKMYSSIESAEITTLEELQKLVDEAKKLKKEDYKETGWKDFTDALATAEAVLIAVKEAETDATKTAPTAEEIKNAYDALKEAMDALISASAVSADINVKKVALTDDFITGADISSYYALKESGVVFKDEKGNPLSDQGFFNYLYDGGMNWARIRIWNDPYNSSGKGYGGGNNDLEKAKVIGKWASNAGMKVLIDFHYSDFWADPSKQKAPKAWAGYSVAQKEDAVYKYTLESLNELRNYGVNVGMVQVGNETNNGICGETKWENMAKLFSAGSKAVREFDKNCLVAVHFTDPQNGYGAIAENLYKSNVDYDVFASSYYPFGHGDAANLRDVLKYVAETYGKKVMAAETSWPTTLVDGDGYGTTSPPTVPERYKDQDYGVSVQGQADEMYALVKAVNEINDEYAGSSLGVFYWEPAWISPYYIKDDEGNDIDSLYKQNFGLWEEYGSGWASSYAAEYDPDDAGVWYGGSAMDNSSWFDFDGTALPTAKIYSLIRTGAVAELKIASVDSKPIKKVNLGEDIDWSKVTVTAKYNNGTETELPVTWEEDETALVNTYKAGEYIVHGIVSEGGNNYKITLTVQVLRAANNNILVNSDFENNSTSPWKIEIVKGHGEAETDPVARVTDEDPHGGELGLHFWSKIDLDFTVSQTVTPEAGTYTFGSYIQGGGADREDVQYAFVKVMDKEGKQKSYQKTAFALNGWKNWVNPEITGITVEAGDTMEVGLIMKSTKDGAWGTMDDFYLYGTHTVSIAESIQHGTVAVNVVKANSGEKIIVTVTPDGGYYPAKVVLSGASVKADTLTSDNGSVAYVPAAGEITENQAVLTYIDKMAEEKTETFMMPNGNVTVSAEFASVFEDGKISLDAKENGKYLVEVNAGESKDSTGEAPIADQFYTGKNVTPEVELSYKGYKLTSADYTVKYENNKDKTTADSKAKIILTAKGDKFTGTREILFEIKADTRSDFNAKKLKVVFEDSDKNGRTDKTAQAIYYLGTEKEIEPKISLYNVTDSITDTSKAIDPSLYEVYYQNNKKIGKATLVVLPSEEAMGRPDGYKEGSITSAFTIAKCPINQNDVKVEMSAKPSYYTGKKAEPAVIVTYNYTDQNKQLKTVTLVKGRDYTVSYTNNLNASVYEVKDEQGNVTYQAINPKKVPTVKITGKGNFTGIRTTLAVDANGKAVGDKITFQILPRSVTNTTITVADLAEKTSAQAPKITVKDGTKTVAANQYVIEKIVRTHDAENKPLAEAEVIYSRDPASGTSKVTAAGTYAITIAGKAKSNYADKKDVDNAGFNDKLTFRVVDKDYLIDNAKISISGKFYYTGDQVTLSTSGDDQNLTVKSPKETLIGFESRNAAIQDGVEQDGYYVTYRNNVSAGKAVITVTGTGKYAGTKTSTFAINKRTIAMQGQVSDNDKDKKGEIQTPKISVKVAEEKIDGVWIADAAKGALINSDNTQEESGSLEVPYTGYTINPDFKFYSINYDSKGQNPTNKEMSTGDYTVSYKVGKWANGKAPVTVTVKGKGNYSGSVKFDNLFTLTERDFSKLSIKVESATYNGKALKPAVTFYDENGKVVDLKLGTAYTVIYKNNKEANQKPDKQPTVTVKPKGKGWSSVSGSITKTFAIEQAEINKPDIEDVKFQTFLGKALKPKVTVKVNGKKLKEGKDYTMTYSKNVKRGGSATITITGKGNYYTRQPIVKTFIIK